jgi:hypothetical protein
VLSVRRSGQPGRSLAIAGIVIGAVLTVFTMLGLGLWVLQAPTEIIGYSHTTVVHP